jgi:hypothetical protein
MTVADVVLAAVTLFHSAPSPVQAKLRDALAGEAKAKEKAATFRSQAEASAAEVTAARRDAEEARAATAASNKLVGALNNDLQQTQVRECVCAWWVAGQ